MRVGSVVWAADNRTLFYTVEDEEQKRQYQFWRHTLGTPHSADVLVYQGRRRALQPGRRPHPRRQISGSGIGQPHHQRIVGAARRRAQWRLHAHQPARRRARVFHRSSQRPVVHPHQRSRAATSASSPRRWPRRDASTGPSSFRIATTSCSKMWISSPASLLPASAKTACLACACGRFDWRQARKLRAPAKLPSLSRPTAPIRTSTASLMTSTFRYAYQSLVTPSFGLRVRSGNAAPRRSSSSLKFPAASTARSMPASASSHRARRRQGSGFARLSQRQTRAGQSNPLYVYGYGSYGYSLPLGFSSNRLSLLDRGVVMAYAHIRGGGDLGKPWHDAGKMLVKRNTFTDFIAAVEHLGGRGLWRSASRGHRRRVGRRVADGRRRQLASRSLPRRHLARSVCRRDEHHARRLAAAHRSRV